MTSVVYQKLMVRKIEILMTRSTNHVQAELINAIPSSQNHTMDYYASAEFLIYALTNEPTKSEYFREHLPKGIRSNYFFLSMYSLADASADNNGAYKHTRNTYKTYFYKDIKAKLVHDENRKLYHNVKETYKSYKKDCFIK